MWDSVEKQGLMDHSEGNPCTGEGDSKPSMSLSASIKPGIQQCPDETILNKINDIWCKLCSNVSFNQVFTYILDNAEELEENQVASIHETIKMKVNSREYQSTDEFCTDVETLVHEISILCSQVSNNGLMKATNSLKKILCALKSQLQYDRNLRRIDRQKPRMGLTEGQMVVTNEDAVSARSDVSSSADDSPISQLFNAVKAYNVGLGIQPFLRLPSKRMYPDYYVEIGSPISMYEIKRKIKSQQYSRLSDIVSDLNLMFTNAMRYNQEYSDIWMTARDMRQYVLDKARELSEEDEKMFAGTPSSAKRPRPAKRSSASSCRKTAAHDFQLSESNIMSLFAAVKDCTVDSRKPSMSFYRLSNDNVLGLEDVDLEDIQCKVTNRKYPNEQEFVADLSKMFNSVKALNGTESQAGRDAITLRRVLDRKLRQLWASLPHANASESTKAASYQVASLDAIAAAAATTSPGVAGQVWSSSLMENDQIDPCLGLSNSRENCKQRLSLADDISNVGAGNSSVDSKSNLNEKLQAVFNAVRSYVNPTTRQLLCADFINLPPKAGYPDYYQVIRKPIDMTRIQLKITANSYSSLSGLVADFAHLFHNACVYNEPTSTIYGNALTLHRVMMSTAAALTPPFTVPDVQSQVQGILLEIFNSVMMHEDEDGRRYSETFNDFISTAVNYDGECILPLRYIEINIKKRRYRRLDVLQDHMVQLFDYARNISLPDSQLFEDSIALQSHFLKVRDDLCGNGERLISPARSLTLRQFLSDMEAMQSRKSTSSSFSDLGCVFRLSSHFDGDPQLSEISTCVGILRPGNFVKIKQGEPHKTRIVCIGGFRQKSNAHVEIWPAVHFIFPGDTDCVWSRRFIKNEVFLTQHNDAVRLESVEEICHVAHVKDYQNKSFQGIAEQNVFICESLYSAETRTFRKLKAWEELPLHDSISCTPRSHRIRVQRESMSTENKCNDEIDWPSYVIHRSPEEIPCENESADGTRNFEQVCVNQTFFKLGDFAEFKQDGREESLIVEILSLWKDKTGDVFAKGPYYVHPVHVPHEPTRLFYRKEILRYGSETITVSFSDVLDKCAVLDLKKYCHWRPTEIPESNVYICDYKYFVEEKAIRRLRKTVRRPRLVSRLVEDEILFLNTELQPPKVASPHLIKAEADPSLDIGYAARTIQDDRNGTAYNHTGSLLQADVDYGNSKGIGSVKRDPADVDYYESTDLPDDVKPIDQKCQGLSCVNYPLSVDESSDYPHNQDSILSADSSRDANEVYGTGGTPYVPADPYSLGFTNVCVQFPTEGIARSPSDVAYLQNETGTKSPSQGSRQSRSRARVKKTNRQPCGYLIYASEMRKKMLKEAPDAPFGLLSKQIGEKWRNLSEKERAVFEQKARIRNEEFGNSTAEASPAGNATNPAKEAPKMSSQPTSHSAGSPFRRNQSSQLLQRLQQPNNHHDQLSRSISPNVRLSLSSMTPSSQQQPMHYRVLSASSSETSSAYGNAFARMPHCQRHQSPADEQTYGGIACSGAYPAQLYLSHPPVQPNGAGYFTARSASQDPQAVLQPYANASLSPVASMGNPLSPTDPSVAANVQQYRMFEHSPTRGTDAVLCEIQSPGLYPQRPSILRRPTSVPAAAGSSAAMRKRNHVAVYNRYLQGLRGLSHSKHLSDWQSSMQAIAATSTHGDDENNSSDFCARLYRNICSRSTLRDSLCGWFNHLKPNQTEELVMALNSLRKSLLQDSIRVSSYVEAPKIILEGGLKEPRGHLSQAQETEETPVEEHGNDTGNSPQETIQESVGMDLADHGRRLEPEVGRR